MGSRGGSVTQPDANSPDRASVAASPTSGLRYRLLASSGRLETHPGVRLNHPHPGRGPERSTGGVTECSLFRSPTSPSSRWYIGVLVFLEGLLSADNALVLALMVRHLPRPEQRRVLRWGLWGAVGFRFIAVLLSAVLLKFWIFKVLGGGYLLYLAIKHFLHTEGGPDAGPRGWDPDVLGDGDGRDVGRHRLLDRLDPRRGRDGRRLPRPVRRQRQAVHRLRRRRARHHHDAVRGPLLRHPARPVPRPGPGCLRPRGLDRAEAGDQRIPLGGIHPASTSPSGSSGRSCWRSPCSAW